MHAPGKTALTPHEVDPKLLAECRRIAASLLRRERRDHTLQPTALMHEAWMRLAKSPDAFVGKRENTLQRFAQVMRHVLIDHANARARQKRPSSRNRVTLSEISLAAAEPKDGLDLLALDAALTRLGTLDERAASVVEMYYFAGVQQREIASHLGVALRTVESDLTTARLWLARELSAKN